MAIDYAAAYRASRVPGAPAGWKAVDPSMPSRLIPEGMSVNKTVGDGWTHYDYGLEPQQQNKVQNLGNQYLGQYNKLGSPVAGQVEGGAAQGLFYNPTGKVGGFQSLTGAALEDPTVYGNVAGMYKNPEADKAWGDLLNQASGAAKQRFHGSTFSLAPEVISKMWK